MCLSLTASGHGNNDEYPTFPAIAVCRRTLTSREFTGNDPKGAVAESPTSARPLEVASCCLGLEDLGYGLTCADAGGSSGESDDSGEHSEHQEDEPQQWQARL